jgi:hypothetical protein
MPGAGAGGDGFNGTASGGAAGTPQTTASLIPLRGGCAGGIGGKATGVPLSMAGAGGGALQISASSMLTVTSTGELHAGGGGGGSAPNGTAAKNLGASGGGSGGGILLEAPTLRIDGKVCANGGGGGGAGYSLTSNDPAADGDCMGAAKGGAQAIMGGLGSQLLLSGQAGESATNSSNSGGGAGGGGGAGVIITRGNKTGLGPIIPAASSIPL